ncbi:MAG: ABC transporter permease [Bacteroidia bacterium]|nr:ABC transporter permease [Bacteroidia bacterium]
MTASENIRIALSSIRANMLRTVITCLIIAIGISALVGMLTAIDGMEEGIGSTFSKMGSNTFNIRNRASSMHFGGGGKKQESHDVIDYQQAVNFKRSYSLSATVALSVFVSRGSVIKHENLKTNPNIRILGIDENYLPLTGSELESGRGFSAFEANSGSKSAIIGKDVENGLFPGESALGKDIAIGGIKYVVTGVLKSKGSSMGMGGEDRIVYISLTEAKSQYVAGGSSYSITVSVNNITNIDAAVAEATGQMRVVRKLKPYEADDFEITKSDAVAKSFTEMLSSLTFAATFIAFITLVGAAIGLMNIMLVSVTERTKEIGTRKAIGATPQIIRRQFLFEAAVICQIGGLFGILGGIGLGNIVSLLFGVGFIIPWMWMLLAVIICFVVGIAAGIYPAYKASKLDPIEALRYE